jgi:hypothetical protein
MKKLKSLRQRMGTNKITIQGKLRRFFQGPKKNWLLLLAFFVLLVVFLFGGFSYLGDRKEITRIKKTVAYLESKKEEVTSLQKAVYIQYPTVEENIEGILKKMNITSSSFKEISSNEVEKKLLLSISNIDYPKFTELIFELEDASPTLILEKVLISVNNDKLKVSLEISGLI